MSNSFNKLVQHLAEYHVTVDPAYLHGLLTGCATIPAIDLDNVFRAIAGEQVLAEFVIAAVVDSIDAIEEDLSAHQFQARFDPDQEADANSWLDGYFKAVEIHQEDWQDLNESHLSAGANLMMLHTMRDEKLHRDLTLDLPGPENLKQNPQLVTGLVSDTYDQFQSDTESGFPMPDDDLPPLHFTDDELAGLNEVELMLLVTSTDDELPIEAVTECASRREAIVPLLQAHLDNDAHWSDKAYRGNWWGLLHAVFILGMIPGEASAKPLLGAFRRIVSDTDNDLADWLSGSWPALFRNKREFTTARLRQIAEDQGLGWYARSHAIECVLADAAEQSNDAIENAIDWLAAMCGNEVEDTEFRVLAGHCLLDFPRERHRNLMEALVDLQTPGSSVHHAYSREDIERSFREGDSPEWRRFDNPWRFYDPDQIQRRLERWRDEDRDFESAPYDPIESWSAKPYRREDSKVSRNEPCPCGSGKKYKKCCLNIER